MEKQSKFTQIITRWKIYKRNLWVRLQSEKINLIYKQGKLLKVADTLSRAQLAEIAEEVSEQDIKSSSSPLCEPTKFQRNP